MDVTPDTEYRYLGFVKLDHPTYWVRFWDPPEQEGWAWSARSVVVSGADDVNEVIAWADAQHRVYELSVEAEGLGGDEPYLVHIAGEDKSAGEAVTQLIAVPSELLPGPTERLRFRVMEDADLDLIAGLLGDPDVMAHYPAPKTRDESQAWIDWSRRNYVEHGYGLWVIETHDGEFVGDCGLTWQPVEDRRELEVGYHLLPQHQGRGLATEAAAACRDLAFEQIGVELLVAVIAPDNRPSQRVAERIGMRRLLEQEREGRRSVVYGMTAADPRNGDGG